MQPNYKVCKETDWREFGLRDAKNDKPLEETFESYNSLCRNFDEKELKPDLTMYRFGHAAGVKELCTFDHGREYGLNRRITSNNCSNKKYPDFFKGIKAGVKEYCVYGNGHKLGLEGRLISKVCKKNIHRSFYQGVKSANQMYCTFEFGKKTGENELPYSGACKGEQEKDFMRGHAIGKSVSLVKKLTQQNIELKVENAKLIERNQNYRTEIFNLESQNEDLKERISELEDRLAQAKSL